MRFMLLNIFKLYFQELETARLESEVKDDSSMSDAISTLQSQVNTLQDEKSFLECTRDQDGLVIARWEREKSETDTLHQLLRGDIDKLHDEK